MHGVYRNVISFILDVRIDEPRKYRVAIVIGMCL